MTSTSSAADTGLPDATRANVVAFLKQHRFQDPLDRQNLEHTYIAMHVAAQYDEDRIDGFISELIAEDRAGDIANLLKKRSLHSLPHERIGLHDDGGRRDI